MERVTYNCERRSVSVKNSLGLLALVILSLSSISSAQTKYDRPRLITVSGTAEVKVVPDQAVLVFGVESRDKELAGAKADHDNRMKRVLGVVRNAGVDEKDVATSRLSMDLEYPERKWAAQPSGYDVSQTVTVTLKNLDKYESLVSALLSAGVNRIQSVEFRVGEPAKYREEARINAIKVAKEKATAMAAQLDQTIGKPWDINEGMNYDGPMQVQANAYAFSTMERSGGGGGGDERTTVAGVSVIRAFVTVSFELQ